ncbi:MAG: hypothetical protein KBS34_03250 [Phascolarctobacterium sp.]|nr:hypothetical protein [Candidatus Phascolarctobacterium equi]
MMTVKSDKEYSKRYRMKKKLIEEGNKLFREWELKKLEQSSRTPREVKASIDALLVLPEGWTEKDYRSVKTKLGNFRRELYGEGNLDLQQDIVAVRKTPKESLKATKTMKKAYTALVQTLELASDDPNDEAAAVIQMARYVGRKLYKQGNVAQNDANAFCLAVLGHDYFKPKWLEEHMQKLVEKNCHNLGFSKADNM